MRGVVEARCGLDDSENRRDGALVQRKSGLFRTGLEAVSHRLSECRIGRRFAG